MILLSRYLSTWTRSIYAIHDLPDSTMLVPMLICIVVAVTGVFVDLSTHDSCIRTSAMVCDHIDIEWCSNLCCTTFSETSIAIFVHHLCRTCTLAGLYHYSLKDPVWVTQLKSLGYRGPRRRSISQYHVAHSLIIDQQQENNQFNFTCSPLQLPDLFKWIMKHSVFM